MLEELVSGDCFGSHKVASNWPSEFHIMGTINGYIHAAHADKENILIGRAMKMIVKRFFLNSMVTLLIQ